MISSIIYLPYYLKGLSKSFNVKLHNNLKIDKFPNSYIQGQAFEKKEDTKYTNITYVIEDMLGNNIKEYNSNDGSFKIENLEDGKEINLIIIDNNNKYNGKYIKNIMPSIDYQKAMKIIQIYRTGSEGMYKIIYHGEPTVTLTGTAQLTKIDEQYFKVTGITDSFTLTLVDYVESDAYLLEKTYK